jgi:hypothetical protein
LKQRRRVLALPAGVVMDDIEFQEPKSVTRRADRRRREKAARLGHRIAKEFRLNAWRAWLKAGRAIYGECTNARLNEIVAETKSYFEDLRLAEELAKADLKRRK